jgi:Helix-turn-helix domain
VILNDSISIGGTVQLKQRPELINPEAAAEFLGLAGPQTLASWRCRRSSELPFIRVGRKIMYDVADLLAFVEGRKVRQTEVEQ